ncbi:superoxide dismutase, Ni [Candidatus Saccharibacteria bacterium]|nr:superoxide dismutase, Ni [Candidatus Saccharibacteria bacterium]
MKLFKSTHAHCDGPCGHYETDTLKNSAVTCRKVMEKILALPDDNEHKTRQQYIRYTMIKDKHAQACKQQVYILWSDYFKAAHYEQYPELINQLYALAQLCSQVKQTVDTAVADDLIAAVGALDTVFRQTQQT